MAPSDIIFLATCIVALTISIVIHVRMIKSLKAQDDLEETRLDDLYEIQKILLELLIGLDNNFEYHRKQLNKIYQFINKNELKVSAKDASDNVTDNSRGNSNNPII